MQNSCPIPMGTSMWLRVCSEPYSPRVENRLRLSSLLLSLQERTFCSRTDRAAQTFRTTSMDDGDADKDPA